MGLFSYAKVSTGTAKTGGLSDPATIAIPQFRDYCLVMCRPTKAAVTGRGFYVEG